MAMPIKHTFRSFALIHGAYLTTHTQTHTHKRTRELPIIHIDINFKNAINGLRDVRVRPVKNAHRTRFESETCLVSERKDTLTQPPPSSVKFFMGFH